MNTHATRDHLLVLVDEPAMVSLLQSLLERAGYSTRVAGDGLEGLRLLSERPPDLIICDIMLPKLSGLEFRRLIMNDEVYQFIPFIFALCQTIMKIRAT